jgi:endonuclease/exonuclease/phosphatase (EEP) superfamily protein YafD
VVRLALASDADVISFQEVSPAWAEALKHALAETYPFFEVVPNDHCYGIALFSRRPVRGMQVHRLCGSPVIEAELTTEGEAVHVFTVHATSPGSLGEHRERNAQLRQLAGMVRARGDRTIVVGDLNTVSWDRAMWGLCAESGLRLGSVPVVPTFPSVLGLALIPIDHVLTTPGTSVVRSDTFVIPGSDHRGLIADIAT